jgi:hypothetical protein
MPHVCSRCRFSFSAKIGTAPFEFHGAPNCFVFSNSISTDWQGSIGKKKHALFLADATAF